MCEDRANRKRVVGPSGEVLLGVDSVGVVCELFDLAVADSRHGYEPSNPYF